ncbi:AMP-dependent synthetase/ligase [Chondromyces crocatus]|uniref:Long-chain fatty acid--CoA ligase n=1 Tax=Chondromyces crocatus TaxID=52 RepID=A0A0K1EEG4_CHOCO|nr:long-chain fatty acid--CoA ligase [Chondromyces crocatus]AKT39261.1 long-chain fatty acid--CoA ligase [Chondromyces crocatus]
MANFENLVELFERSIKLYGSRDLFGTKKDDQWNWLSYGEIGRLVDNFRGGLASLGIQRGDRVAIISNNRVEWAVAAYACYGLGAALVPMYEAQLAKEWAFIINDCEAVAVIAATSQIHEKCREIPETAPTLKHIIGLALPKSDPLSYDALLEAGAQKPVPAIKPTPEDTACLIYTSGTTGNPKGVILTHGNICSNINAVHACFPLNAEDRSLSFLPWAHSFGHTCELHAFLSLGASMALAEAVDKIVPNLAEVKPTVLVSVPRIFNRIYDGVNKQMAAKPAVVRNLFHAGIRIATKKRNGEALSLGDKLNFALANKIVFSKIRQKFGGRLKYAVSGGAALSREVAEFIDGLGIKVFEGYGLTETSPIISANRPDAHRIGSVGKLIDGVKVIIDKTESGDPKHGEIVVTGPNVMKGYHNRPEENQAVFTTDKCFRTGDLGYIDEEGFLYITGRIKEQYKLENGKYVAPAPLEEQLKLSPFILNTMVYGDNRLHNVALVVPDLDAVKEWAKTEGVSYQAAADLLTNARVIAMIQSEVDKYSTEWKGFERVKRITLAEEDFTTDNGMLTPSLKLKRRVAWQRYQKQIESLYETKNKSGSTSDAAA